MASLGRAALNRRHDREHRIPAHPRDRRHGQGRPSRGLAPDRARRPVRVGSGAATPPFDWEDKATWGPALRGAGAAYVSYYPDLAAPGAPEAILDLAAGARLLRLRAGRGGGGRWNG
jgi:hypothetical protein